MEIKRCPFCGSKVSLTYSSHSNKFNIWHDKKCFLSEPIQIDCDNEIYSFEKAIEVWNRRVAQ